MEFFRDHSKTKHWFYASIVGLILMLLRYIFFKFHVIVFFFACILFFPFIYFSYSNYKKENKHVKKVSFDSANEEACFEYLNGKKKNVKYADLKYSFLLQRKFKPIRKIQFKVIRGVRGKAQEICRLKVNSYKELHELGEFLLSVKNIKRDKWNYDWSRGEFLTMMLFFIISPEMSEVFMGISNDSDEVQKAEKTFFDKNKK